MTEDRTRLHQSPATHAGGTGVERVHPRWNDITVLGEWWTPGRQGGVVGIPKQAHLRAQRDEDDLMKVTARVPPRVIGDGCSSNGVTFKLAQG